MSQQYDLIIIGAGAAGLTAAFTAKGLGKKVLLIEKLNPGGECTWSGCIPSKSFIKSAANFHCLSVDSKYGIKRKLSSVNNNSVFESVAKVIKEIADEESFEKLKSSGIDVIQGSAEFKDSTTVKVGSKEYTAKKIHISTGSSPVVPKIPGIEEVKYLTNENVFHLNKIPAKLLVIGAGPIGLELAQSFSRLGSIVTVVEFADRILFREDEEDAQYLSRILEKEHIRIILRSKLIGIKTNKIIRLAKIENSEGKTIEISFDEILFAVGRKPNIEGLNLEAAGIQYTPKGITTGKYLRTNNKSISASGDVAGPLQFSHVAEYQSITAILNHYLPIKTKADYSAVPWATFTDPPLSRLGYTEDEASKIAGEKNIRVYRYSYSKNNRAVTERKSDGMVKIILNRKGFIMGAHIVGERSDELIQQLAIIKSLKIKLSKIQEIIYAYPIYSDMIKRVARAAYIDELNANPVLKIIRLILKLFKGK